MRMIAYGLGAVGAVLLMVLAMAPLVGPLQP